MKPIEITTIRDDVTTTSERINIIREELKEATEGQIVKLTTYYDDYYYTYVGNSWQPMEN